MVFFLNLMTPSTHGDLTNHVFVQALLTNVLFHE
jgi:hypothetical protein